MHEKIQKVIKNHKNHTMSWKKQKKTLPYKVLVICYFVQKVISSSRYKMSEEFLKLDNVETENESLV